MSHGPNQKENIQPSPRANWRNLAIRPTRPPALQNQSCRRALDGFNGLRSARFNGCCASSASARPRAAISVCPSTRLAFGLATARNSLRIGRHGGATGTRPALRLALTRQHDLRAVWRNYSRRKRRVLATGAIGRRTCLCGIRLCCIRLARRSGRGRLEA